MLFINLGNSISLCQLISSNLNQDITLELLMFIYLLPYHMFLSFHSAIIR